MFKKKETWVSFHEAKYRDQYRDNVPKDPCYSLTLENSPEALLGPEDSEQSYSVCFLKEQHNSHTASGKQK